MSTWYKEGCCGELQPEAAEGLRMVCKLFAKFNQDVFITSIRDGSHSPSSFHPSGRAWDMRTNGTVTSQMIQDYLGDTFDVVDEGNHYHIEYDV